MNQLDQNSSHLVEPHIRDLVTIVSRCDQTPASYRLLSDIIQTNDRGFMDIALRTLVAGLNHGFGASMFDAVRRTCELYSSVNPIILEDVLQNVIELFDSEGFTPQRCNSSLVDSLISYQNLILRLPFRIHGNLQVLGSRGLETIDALARTSDHYQEAMALVQTLGIGNADEETYFNFAYGITVIGQERTIELYRSQGIEYFARYNPRLLRSVSDNLHMGASDRPVVLIVANKSDESGAWYSHENTAGYDQLLRAYRVVIVETDLQNSNRRTDMQVLGDIINDTANRHGPIGTIILSGHGTPENIRFGGRGLENPPESAYLDLTDMSELASVVDINRVFVRSNFLVIANACSAGTPVQTPQTIQPSVAQRLSQTWYGAHVFAPDRDSRGVFFDLDERGLIDNVQFYGWHLRTNSFMYGLNVDQLGGLTPRRIRDRN